MIEGKSFQRLPLDFVEKVFTDLYHRNKMNEEYIKNLSEIALTMRRFSAKHVLHCSPNEVLLTPKLIKWLGEEYDRVI